jgi:type II secretory pathway component PulK
MKTNRRTSRHGTIFVTAMWVTIILGAVVLVYARSMRVELIAAANRVSTSQADAIENGVESYVQAAVDNVDGEADYVLSLPGEQCRLGDGYFWLLRPAANQQNYEFGITDEAAKLNINVAAKSTNPSAQLLMLPGITNQQADSIVDWIDTDTQNVTGGDGAENSYYEGLPEPYDAKNADLETIEELLLVQGFGPGGPNQGYGQNQGNGQNQVSPQNPDPLFGIDRNRNGVIEQGEASQGTTGTNSNGETADRGIFPFVTIYSQEPDTDIQGNKRINCSGTGGNNNNLSQQLTTAGVTAQVASKIASAVQRNAPIRNIFDLANKAGLSSQDLATVADKLTFQAAAAGAATGGGRTGGGTGGGTGTTTTSTTTLKGLININTAPREVLMTLTAVSSLTQNDIDSLINERQRADTSTIMWVADSLAMNKAAEIGSFITARSFVYSADIVAVSGDGRAFKRVRIVVDATTSPAKIIYRKDLTALGWPLPEEVRTSLRQGKGPGSSLASGSGGFGGGLGGGMGLGR